MKHIITLPESVLEKLQSGEWVKHSDVAIQKGDTVEYHFTADDNDASETKLIFRPPAFLENVTVSAVRPPTSVQSDLPK